MSTETLLLLIIVFIVIGSLPAWPYSKSWGFAPVGMLSVLLILFIFWAVAQDRPLFNRSGDSIGSAVEEAGDDLRDAGRDVADSVRDAVN